MNDPSQLRATFLFIFIFVAMIFSTASFAALSLSPVVPGYSAASASYRASAGSFTMAAANSGFIQPAVVNVGGKAITVPATLRMASNAGQFAKNAMKLNPWAIAGTLALPWLIDYGLEWIEGQGWVKTIPGGYYWSTNISYPLKPSAQEAANYHCLTTWGVNTHYAGVFVDATHYNFGCFSDGSNGSQAVARESQPDISNPATDADWDALPDPLPSVAPELPYAPYMPEGVPVGAPDYDFAPYQTPLGEPYTKPDGSTAQPMASVSPNGDSITVDTYDQPLTDSNGQPVPNPTPQDTPEPAPDPDICQKNPDSLMCAALGTPPAAETVPTTSLPVDATVTPIGGAGTCPASVSLPHGITWSYQPICDFASAIRPFIIGFAWLSFSYIVVGAIKQ
jgi:hypothetical protein